MKILYVFNNLNCNLGFDQINNLKSQGQTIYVLSIWGSGSQYQKFKSINIPCYFVNNFNTDVNKYRSLLSKIFVLKKTISKINQFILSINPDIVVSNLYLSDILVYLSLLITRKRDIKLISIQHDVVRINPILRFLKIKALDRANYVVAISEAVKQFLIDYFKVSKNKIKVIYNGIEIDQYLSCEKTATDTDLVFGTIARLDKIKGHIYTLKGLYYLKKYYSLAPKFIFVGDGTERVSLEKYARIHNLDNVKFVGYQLNVNSYLSQIDVFVLPSLSEGLGVSIIEAMAAAKCIIASNIDGIKELIVNYKTGFLVEPCNSKAISDKIKWCLENPDKVKLIGKAAQKYILDNRDVFDMKSSILKYASLFEQLKINK